MITRYYQNHSRNRPVRANALSFFKDLDADGAVSSLRSTGLWAGFKLPGDQIDRILEYCNQRPARRYHNPHESCDAVNEIVHDRRLIEIVRRYLGADPILWGSVIYWTTPKKIGEAASRRKAYYHYDVGDVQSLSLFIYLSDVDLFCGPHIVIEGTHQRKTLWQLINPYLREDIAHERYAGRIRVLTGVSGTGFFEDLTCYHRHLPNVRPRLVLTIAYVLRRRPRRCPSATGLRRRGEACLAPTVRDRIDAR